MFNNLLKPKTLVLLGFLIAGPKISAQELNLPVFTQYLADNNFVVSPTFAGIGDYLKIRVNGLTQWVGIKGAPDNSAFYGDFRVGNQMGVGLSLYTDSNGNTKQSGGKISYAYHLTLDEITEQYLSLGLSVNLNSFRIAIENFNTTIENPVIDPYVTDNRSTTNVNFDAGFLYRWKAFFLSFNANNILDKNFDEALRVLEPNLLLNVQLYSGYTFGTNKKYGVEYEPSIFYQLFASDGRSATDLNFKIRKFMRNDNYFWGGISYRFLNDQLFTPLNIGPMLGVSKDWFYFAYAYQFTTNDLAGYNSGTHSVTIGINLLRNISNCPCTRSRSKY
ncbi:PorP/SprF family type IX secretion system membrane protein [Winogradskyella aurantiaca]|uniref:PorP/SprF family type IX secretion system membrane protein n=1 Tax=Winogradskyella aurantiaca TaxID=2219558 RepID=UPI000E1CA2B0|nr:type IX secretion system membrane protein PorP/SprF [Winogradskyella aurantiaca]